MEQITSYHVGGKGYLWVHLQDGNVRRATDAEWIKLWRQNPELTLKLAS